MGAGGVLVPPEGYMEGLRALCDKCAGSIGMSVGSSTCLNMQVSGG